MSDFSVIQGGPVESTPLSSNNLVSVTSGGSTNSKGSWTQLIASTARAASGVIVTFGDGAAGVRFYLDIGIGAAASEQVLIPDLYNGNQVAGTALYQAYFPISIPAGTRISARAQCETATQVIRAGVHLLGSSFQMGSPLSRVTAYGLNSGVTGGLSVDPGGTANTKGAWTQATASTTNKMRWMVVCILNDTRDQTTAGRWYVDVGIGGAGSEQIIVGDLASIIATTSDSHLPGYWSFPVNVPAGVRLALRAQSSTNTATQRLLDACVVYGVD